MNVISELLDICREELQSRYDESEKFAFAFCNLLGKPTIADDVDNEILKLISDGIDTSYGFGRGLERAIAEATVAVAENNPELAKLGVSFSISDEREILAQFRGEEYSYGDELEQAVKEAFANDILPLVQESIGNDKKYELDWIVEDLNTYKDKGKNTFIYTANDIAKSLADGKLDDKIDTVVKSFCAPKEAQEKGEIDYER